MKNPNECIVCSTYERFTKYVKEGIPVEEAFYNSVAQTLEETISDVADEAFSIAYKEGYIDAMRNVVEQAENVADKLEFANEDECDCEDCQLEQEYAKCDDCNCVDDQCEVDIAKAIRRAIWEDETK